LNLNPEQIEESIQIVCEFFNSLITDLESSETWESIGDVLTKHSLVCYYDGTLFHGPSTDPKVNICLCEFLGLFYLPFAGVLYTHREHATKQIMQQADFTNACLLGDHTITELFEENPDISAMDKINILTKLKKFLNGRAQSTFYLHHEVMRTRIYKFDRKVSHLLEWANSEVEAIAPKMHIKNKDQKEGLRLFFLNLISEEKLLIENIDTLLASRFFTDSKVHQVNRLKVNVFPGAKCKPSELIAELFEKLKKLSSLNTTRDIQKWIFQIFFRHDIEGFSFHNIKKITESK
jgi:hypothetical protein